MVTPSKSKFLTPQEATELIGISRSKLYNLINNGYLERHRLPDNSRKVFLLRSEVEGLVTSNLS